jgi:hypothetical protein
VEPWLSDMMFFEGFVGGQLERQLRTKQQNEAQLCIEFQNKHDNVTNRS